MKNCNGKLMKKMRGLQKKNSNKFKMKQKENLQLEELKMKEQNKL